jgi:hypothetical protein
MAYSESGLAGRLWGHSHPTKKSADRSRRLAIKEKARPAGRKVGLRNLVGLISAFVDPPILVKRS